MESTVNMIYRAKPKKIRQQDVAVDDAFRFFSNNSIRVSVLC